MCRFSVFEMFTSIAMYILSDKANNQNLITMEAHEINKKNRIYLWSSSV